MSNALTGFKIDLSKIVTEQVRQQIGKVAIEQLNSRWDAGRDITDGPLNPYSPKGPVYLELTTGAPGPTAARGPLSVAMSAASARRMYRKLNPGGTPPRMSRSQKFPNYAAMKAFLGHPGYRNLKLTGAMRRALKVTSSSTAGISIGFADAIQETKMKENMKWALPWGFSPSDQAGVRKTWETTMAQRFVDTLKRQIGSRWK